jgi:hypothetical protein
MTDFFETIFEQVTIALWPAQEAAQSDWGMHELVGPVGFDLDVVPGLDLAPLQTALADVIAAIEALQAANGPQAIADIAGALESVGSAISAARQAFGGLSQQSGLPAGLAAELESAGERLLQSLIVNWLAGQHPLAKSLLDVLGAIDTQPGTGTPITISSSGAVAFLPVSTDRVNTQTILALFRDPMGTLSTQLFGAPGTTAAGQAQITALTTTLWPRLGALGQALGRAVLPGSDPRYLARTGDLGTGGDQATNATIAFPLADDGSGDLVMLALTLVPPATPGGKNTVVLSIEGEATQAFAAGNWQGSIGATGVLRALAVDTAGNVTLPAASAAGAGLTLTVTVAYTQQDPSGAGQAGAGAQPPALLIGAADGTRIEINQVGLTGTASFGSAAPAGIGVELALAGISTVLDFSDGDGFLQNLGSSLLGGPVRVNADVTIGWDRGRGVYLKGGASFGNAGPGGLSAQLPVNLSLGPVSIPSVTVGLAPSQAQGGEQLALTLGLSASVSIGPVNATVNNVGLSAVVDSRAGNLGALDLSLGFKPPDGLGLALDADPVSGVGFLAFDAPDGRYLGAVALAVGDVSIEAVGVLDTKLPGGATGYSLIVVACAQFPPIQLGFGFSLSGIGGLVGVHRTANVPSLQALARAGRLDDLMFPADLIDRAPQVAANLAQQFPVAQGHFIVGPAVQVQWGTGGMVEADVGVFIELSDSGGGITVLRIALLGLVHLALPDEAAPVADITLDVLGVLDFSAKTLSLDAGLRNSTIATFPLTGQAALRAGWGSTPEFLFAVGGFNPHFAAPAGFPALQRIALSIGGDNPRLRLSAYLALTSNTLQLGCAADLYASASEAGVTAAVSASLTFDALVQFKPFGLIVDLTITAAILVNNNPILTLSLDLHVTGPDPWTVTGSASFGFLWFSVTVPISITAGPAPLPQSPQPVDLDGNLITALADPRSWATGAPSGRGLVRVRSQGSADTAVHPLGSLTVRQHAVPLGQRIERYGPDPLDAPCRYDITGTGLGAQAVSGTAVTDFFAPAQFLTMSDADKLSAPSFETMTAGTTIGSSGLTLPATPGSGQAPATVADSVSTATWDTLTLDSPDPAATPAPAAPAAPAPAAAAPAGPPAPAAAPASVIATPGSTSVPDSLLAAQLGGAAAALAGPAGQPGEIYASPGIGIAVQEPQYAITGLNLAAPATATAITTWHLTSVTAGLTLAAQAGYQHNWQVIYTSEVP